jgi:hypothetical protein
MVTQFVLYEVQHVDWRGSYPCSIWFVGDIAVFRTGLGLFDPCFLIAFARLSRRIALLSRPAMRLNRDELDDVRLPVENLRVLRVMVLASRGYR